MDINPLQKAVNPTEIAPEQLAGNTALNEQQKIAEASRQFEAILLRQILAATQKTIIPSKFADNSTSADIYRDMITTQLADSISKSGSFGLAKTFEHQLTHPPGTQPASASHPTASRDAHWSARPAMITTDGGKHQAQRPLATPGAPITPRGRDL
jgi:flagellar protein FlgJ